MRLRDADERAELLVLQVDKLEKLRDDRPMSVKIGRDRDMAQRPWMPREYEVIFKALARRPTRREGWAGTHGVLLERFEVFCVKAGQC